MKQLLNFFSFRKEKLRVRFQTIQVTSEHAKTFPKYARLLTTETLYLQKLLGFKKHEKCLDVGCGYGRLTNIIANHTEQYTGLEPERKLFRIAKKLYPGHTFVRAPADSIPFKNNSFDLIVAWTVLQHIKPQMIERSINEIKRVATKEAIIILSEYTKQTNQNNKRTFGRTVAQYKEFFRPFELVDKFPRDVGLNQSTGMILIFQFKKRRKKKND